MGDEVKEVKPSEDAAETEKAAEKLNSAVSAVSEHVEAVLEQLRESGAAPLLLTGASEGQDAESKTRFLLQTALIAEKTVVSDLLNVLTKLQLTAAHQAVQELIPERTETGQYCPRI